MMRNTEIKMLEEIRKLDAERLGIRELRKHNSDLYGYYMKWLVKKENTMIRKYIRKYDRWPDLTGSVLIPNLMQNYIPTI